MQSNLQGLEPAFGFVRFLAETVKMARKCRGVKPPGCAGGKCPNCGIFGMIEIADKAGSEKRRCCVHAFGL